MSQPQQQQQQPQQQQQQPQQPPSELSNDTFKPYHSSSHAFFGINALDESLRLLSHTIFENITIAQQSSPSSSSLSSNDTNASTDSQSSSTNDDNDVDSGSKTPMGSSCIEIEGKLGLVINRQNDKRMYVGPVRSECVMEPNQNTEFQSSLDQHTFKRLNHIVNSQVETLIRNSGYRGPKIAYERTKEIDQFIRVPMSLTGGPLAREKKKVRVSCDAVTGEPKYAIQKRRIANLDFHCPHTAWDFRISISEEKKLPVPDMSTAIIDRERIKDRLSYRFGKLWRLDITHVTTRRMDSYGRPVPRDDRITYEVELECDTDHLSLQKAKMMRGEPNEFQDCMETFLSHMRALVIQASPKPGTVPPPTQQQHLHQHQVQQQQQQQQQSHRPSQAPLQGHSQQQSQQIPRN